MARGKQAVRAANRRVEAVNSHVDRLTDQLADAKARAKKYEKDALLLPHVRDQLEQEKEHNRLNTSAELERTRRQLLGQKAEHAEQLCAVALIAIRVAERADSKLTADEWNDVLEVIPYETLIAVRPEFNHGRPSRRQHKMGSEARLKLWRLYDAFRSGADGDAWSKQDGGTHRV